MSNIQETNRYDPPHVQEGATTATTEGGGTRGLVVAPEDTVPAQVKWEPEQRRWHDKFWSILYALSFVAYLACGFTLVGKAHARWESHQVLSKVDEVNGIAILEEVTVRTVSQYYYDDAMQCCEGQANSNTFLALFDDDLVVHNLYPLSSNLCLHLNKDDAVRRKLQTILGNTPPNSKFEQGDGMFVS
jgi:hypothetical protein